jgi:hypothetical protein
LYTSLTEFKFNVVLRALLAGMKAFLEAAYSVMLTSTDSSGANMVTMERGTASTKSRRKISSQEG